MRVLLFDPSLFTGPYDGALDAGLRTAGIDTVWFTRPLRPGEAADLPADRCQAVFYKRSDALPGKLRAAAKGLSHLSALLGLPKHLQKADIVHLQWAVLPVFDALAIRIIRLSGKPVVMTVHDTTPFNGETISFLQNLGFDLPLKAADHLIVHTQSARDTLAARGLDVGRISVIPHGALDLKDADAVNWLAHPTPRPDDERYHLLMFGQIKPYKGLDILIEAMALVDPALLSRLHVTIAGAPHMDMTAPLKRVTELGLDDVFDFRLSRQSERQMAELFSHTDAFVFPYRQIDASGVFFMTQGFGKWTIASRVGVFAETLTDANGALVEPESPAALAASISDAVTKSRKPDASAAVTSWRDIGQSTRAVYEGLLDRRRKRRGA